MNEIKIRFKNGKIGYFKLVDAKIDIETLFDDIGNWIIHGQRRILKLIDLDDNKLTIIDVLDIATFGYSPI